MAYSKLHCYTLVRDYQSQKQGKNDKKARKRSVAAFPLKMGKSWTTTDGELSFPSHMRVW